MPSLTHTIRAYKKETIKYLILCILIVLVSSLKILFPLYNIEKMIFINPQILMILRVSWWYSCGTKLKVIREVWNERVSLSSHIIWGILFVWSMCVVYIINGISLVVVSGVISFSIFVLSIYSLEWKYIIRLKMKWNEAYWSRIRMSLSHEDILILQIIIGASLCWLYIQYPIVIYLQSIQPSIKFIMFCLVPAEIALYLIFMQFIQSLVLSGTSYRPLQRNPKIADIYMSAVFSCLFYLIVGFMFMCFIVFGY